MIGDELGEAQRLDPERKRALLAELLRARAEEPRSSPLSSGQRRLWLLDRLEPGTATYNVPFAFRLRGALDRTALGRALEEIVRRHDALGAVVTLVDGEPEQRVEPGFRLPLAFVDLSVHDAPLEAVLAVESARSFDLHAAPAIRALLIGVAADEHVLLVTMHHIATDGWSTAIFKRELGTLYDAYLRGEAAPLRAVRSTYADFARWQSARFSGTLLQNRLRFWKTLGAAPALELGTRRALAERTSHGRTESLGVEPATRDALYALSREQRSTLFSTLFAAFVALLHRYTGRRDISIGCANANRTRSDFEDTIGFFVNTLPLRTRIEGDPTFAELLARVHATVLEAFDNDVPFEKLVEELHPARDATRSPLVEIMFVLQNAPDETLALRGLAVSAVPLERTTAKFDLTLAIVESPEGLDATLEYRTDLFDAPAVAALLDAFRTLLRDIVREPNRRLSKLQLLSEPARRRQLVDWNDTARPLRGLRIERLFEEQATRTPDNIAVVGERETLSYAALNARANRLAHYLRSIGIGAGSRVGICVERGSDMVIGIVAILKAGGAYVPFDADDPRERARFVLADTGATIVLTQRRFVARLRGLAVRTFSLDDGPERLADFASTNPASAGTCADAAYVMYTSGTTGTPKGVVIPHRAIERLACDTNCVRLGADDAVAQASTISFDASTFELWGALLCGARLVIVPKRVLLDAHALAAHIAASGISVMFVTTALFKEIVRKAPSTFGGLRSLLIGGEALTPESVAMLFAGEPPGRIVNCYGPTEATTFATSYTMQTPPGPGPISIGRPISNTEVYVLDEGHALLPAGATGQLFVGGPGLALEYLNDAELTRRKFVPHPFASEPGATLYATGDRARFLASGELAYAGRMDAQVKLRGFRIEPAEIEAVLRAYPGVDDAVLLVREDAAGNRRLVGYVAVGEAGCFPTSALQRALRDRLPAHMIPDAIVPVDALPLTPSGKIDRGALPEPSRERAGPDGMVTSRNDLERQLTVLWEQVLGVAPVGVRDDFFALGGHSLLAVRLIGEIERAFRTRLPLAVLFERPTIERLADALRDDPASLNRAPLLALRTEGTEAPFFFLHGSIDGGGYYCLALAERLSELRPLYVLRPHGVDGGPIPATIAAMADDYVALVLAVRAHGPYVLGGYCSGALVALEIARRLRRRGETVSNVVLVDAPDAGRPIRAVIACVERIGTLLEVEPRRRAALAASLARFACHVRRFAATPSKHRFIARRLPRLAARLGAVLTKRLLRSGAARRDALPSVIERMRGVTESYVPERYDGRITILAANAPRGDARRTARGGWSLVARHVDHRAIPGDHYTCITDSIDGTAREIAAALDGTRERFEDG